jgi:stress-induced morphogen
MVGFNMTIKLRTSRPDKLLKEIVAALREYEKKHTRAQIEVYRHSSVSIRIRVINPEFKGQSRAQREEEVWRAFDPLPDETVAEVSVLLLLTPDEATQSFANVEFENPVPSKL